MVAVSMAAPMSVPDYWAALPEGVRRLLLHGSCGGAHLVGAASQALLAARAEPARRAALLGLALELALAAWGENPLDGGLARDILDAAAQTREALPGPVDALLKAQVHFWGPPPQDHPWHAVRTPGQRREAAVQGLAAEPKNLFWKLAAWELAWQNADRELAEAVLDQAAWPRTLAPLRQRLAAQDALCAGDAHLALAALNAAPELETFAPDPGLRAEVLLRLGRRDEARAVLAAAVARQPWRSSQWLRLHDLEQGLDTALAELSGPAAVLLYSFNKADELDATLASLEASTLGGASLWALDNGSADATWDVLERWRERLGGRLSTLRLPVNIGAPAARNWLLSLPEVRRHPWLVFVDDDVSLPADWLLRLGAAAQAEPGASVWGCRVVDEACPLVLQSVDLTPLPGGDGRPLALPQLHHAGPDLGRFSYLRPCVSVTGCCHLLREADVDRTGGFDIRFSPSQFDDLERDLRLGMGGGFAVYQGHLAVDHKRRSGAAAERGAAEQGNAAGNTHKLVTKHAAEAFRTLRERGEARLLADLTRKMERLARAV